MHGLFHRFHLLSSREGGNFSKFFNALPVSTRGRRCFLFRLQNDRAEEAGESVWVCSARRHGRYKRETKLISQDYQRQYGKLRLLTAPQHDRAPRQTTLGASARFSSLIIPGLRLQDRFNCNYAIGLSIDIYCSTSSLVSLQAPFVPRCQHVNMGARTGKSFSPSPFLFLFPSFFFFFLFLFYQICDHTRFLLKQRAKGCGVIK